MRQKRFGTSHVHHTRIENALWRSCWDWLPERFRKSRSFKRKCHAETQAKTPLAAGEGGRPCSCLNVLTGMRRRRFSRAGGGDAGEPDPLLARCAGGVPGVRRCELDVQPADGDVPPLCTERYHLEQERAFNEQLERERAHAEESAEHEEVRRERDMMRQRNSRLCRKYGLKGRRERKK